MNSHNRLRPSGASVIAGPLAEWPLGFIVALDAFSFEHDLRRGGNRQSGEFALDNFDGFPLDAADKIILANAIGNFEGSRQKNQRIVAHRYRDFEWLTAHKCFVAMNAPVSSRGNVEPHGILIVNHHPRRAKVGPPFFRVVGDIDAAGSDIPPAVQLKPAWRRKRQDIDILAMLNIFSTGPSRTTTGGICLSAFDLLRHSATNSSELRCCGMPKLSPSRLVEPSELTKTR